MGLCIRKPGIDAVIVTAFLGWAFLCVVWLFYGSGYPFLQPTVYELTTRFLLSSPETASEASKIIESQGYLSIIEQRRLLSRITQ